MEGEGGGGHEDATQLAVPRAHLSISSLSQTLEQYGNFSGFILSF